MEALFAFGAALVWWEIILIAILSLSFGWSLLIESATISGIALAIFFWVFIGTTGTMTWGGVAIALAVYIIIGLAWSIFKWRNFVKKKKEEYIIRCDRYNRSYDADSLRSDIAAAKNHDVIGFWIIAWPFSVIAYLIGDFVADLIKKLVNNMGRVYDNITDSIVGN